MPDDRAAQRGCRTLLVAFLAIGCASSGRSTSPPSSVLQTSVAPSPRPGAAASSAPAGNRSIKVLLSSESDQAFCNGERMDSDGYRRTLTREQEVALPAPGGSLRDDIHAVLDVTTTGMCNTVMQKLDVRVERDEAHIPPISGWAGVSIVMCHCIPEVELNLVRIPGIARVIWDEDEDAPPPEKTYSFKTTYPDAQAITATEWKRQHGALGPLRDERCWDLRQGVGIPAAPALLCWHTASTYLPEYFARIYRLEGKTLHQVWQGTVATWTNWLDLTPIVADDGASLVVHDRRQGSCEGASAEAHAKIASSVDVPWLPIITRGCQQRGVWEYRETKFVQVEKVSPPDLFR